MYKAVSEPVKKYLKKFFAFIGWNRENVEQLRRVSSWGIAVGFTMTLAAVFYPEFPSLIFDIFLGDYSGFLEAAYLDDSLFNFLIGFLVLSTSSLIHLALDIYLDSFESISRFSEKKSIKFLVVASFFSSFVIARTLVILSGIVGPETSSGIAGFIPVNEIWFQGYHIHHFFFGFLFLVISGWLLLFTERSKKLTAILYGTGIGIFVDEIGMLLTEGDYFARSTYFVAVTFTTLLLAGMYWDRATFAEEKTVRQTLRGILPF